MMVTLFFALVWLLALLVAWLVERRDQRRVDRSIAQCQCLACRRKKTKRLKYTMTKAYKKWSRYYSAKSRRRR